MLEIAHSPRPFLPPVRATQRIEHLDLLDSAPMVRPTDSPADVDAALLRLLAEGLVGRASRDPRTLLFGGTSKSSDSEITSYQEPFMISRESDGTLLAGVAGPGQLSETARVKTLQEATDFVIGIYVGRRKGA